MKNELMEAFRKRLEEMPFDKIKVTDLCLDCGVNRQTFCYHFNNLSDLASHFIKRETEGLLHLEEEPFTWEDKVNALIEYLDSNRDMCLSLLSSMEHKLLKNILSQDTERLISRISESSVSGGTAILDVPGEERDFYIKFYALAVSGLVESWIMGDIKMSPEKLIGYIKNIIRKNIQHNNK